MRIYSNFKERELLSYWDIPEKVRKDQFDYLAEGEGSFFKYKGTWYSLDQFMKIQNAPTAFQNWDGYYNDSFFSGVLLKMSDDGYTCKVGTFIS